MFHTSIFLFISIVPKDVNSKPGQKVQFSVASFPGATKYEWYFQETLISVEDDSYEDSTTSTLTIANVLPKHKGVYKCIMSDFESKEVHHSLRANLKLSKFIFGDVLSYVCCVGRMAAQKEYYQMY